MYITLIYKTCYRKLYNLYLVLFNLYLKKLKNLNKIKNNLKPQKSKKLRIFNK